MDKGKFSIHVRALGTGTLVMGVLLTFFIVELSLEGSWLLFFLVPCIVTVGYLVWQNERLPKE